MKFFNATRIFMGIIYFTGAATNFYLVLSNPQIYRDFAGFAIIPFYKTLWLQIVMKNPIVWIMLVVAFEITAAVFILNKGNLVKIGLAGVVIFNLFLFPFWWFGWSFINLFLALIQFILIRQEYDSTVIEMLSAGLRKNKGR